MQQEYAEKHKSGNAELKILESYTQAAPLHLQCRAGVIQQQDHAVDKTVMRPHRLKIPEFENIAAPVNFNPGENMSLCHKTSKIKIEMITAVFSAF